ncbi:uncharacterized protein [Drosophila bipectinata]|uniref:uncharacterized protein n=1 Tax=Drosophila bipectinata TaxID=42026 RepID=UPI001C8982D4|nr:uncharacterized protein LOC108120874 [Drosophila bipectinata]
MSFVRYPQFFVRISSRDGRRKVMKVFENPLYINEILSAAGKFGIVGSYLISAEDNAVIADVDTLLYFIRKGHTIIVADNSETIDHITLEEIGESHTDDENHASTGLEEAKKELFCQIKRFSAQFVNVVSAFTDFVMELSKMEDPKSAAFQAGLLNMGN